MSSTHSPKEYIAPYEMLSEWDEVLLGDEELFKEMAAPYTGVLLNAAQREIKRKYNLGNLSPDLLQPEELVGETLIEAWHARHGRNTHRPLKDWLLEVQRHALQKIIEKEKKLREPIAASLEEPVPAEEKAGEDANEYWQWVEPKSRDRWGDIIPDDNAHPAAV